MDKYEFNIKVEQLKKMVKAGDYATAMKIADPIDWRRVNSVSLLSTVSEVYEKNRDYAMAKEILMLAYERVPIGKRLLYKLCLLSLDEGNIPEAEAYFREFYDLAPDDSRQHILRYLILKEKGAPDEQLIHTLEQFNRVELDEKWMYELAELYHRAGKSDQCVAMCDNIMLMFGIGSYVDKAIELKTVREGRELTPYQQSLVDNREKYEERLREVQAEYDREYDVTEADIRTAASGEEEYAQMVESQIREETETEKISSQVSSIASQYKSDELPQTRTKVLDNIRDAFPQKKAEAEDAPVKAAEEAAPVPETVAVPKAAEPEKEPEVREKPVYTVNFIVSRKNPKDGFEAAVGLLKLMHQHTGSQNKAAKISAGKLNEIGILASQSKLAGKDLVIEEAGDLVKSRLEELMELIRTEPEERVVILSDNPMQIRKLTESMPALLEVFHVDEEDETAGSREPETMIPAEAAEPEKPVRKETAPAPKKPAPEPEKGPELMPVKDKPDDEMSMEEFEKYACKYAKSIDCAISGKTELALFERIELMEEEGIPLTAENAVNLIEEAADRAEKKTLGSLFTKKYDKNDMLILREEHFIP